MAIPIPETSATEESGSTPIPPSSDDRKETPRGFLDAARRNLTEEDLSTPAARRFLLAEIERMDQICIEHQELLVKYSDQRVVIAELRKEDNTARKADLLSNLCLSVGSIGLGAAPGYLGLAGGGSYGAVILCAAALLIVFGSGLFPRPRT